MSIQTCLSSVKTWNNSTGVFLSHRGLNKQGYKCRRECFIDPLLSFLLTACWISSAWHILFVYPECNAAIHKRCIEKIIGKCTGSAANSRDTMVSKVNVWASALVVRLICYSWQESHSHWVIDYLKVALCQGRKRKPHSDNLSADKMALVDVCMDMCSSRKSASRLTCRIASRLTTTRVPPSVTTAAACCGACTDKASSVKVGSHFVFIFSSVKQKFCLVSVTNFFPTHLFPTFNPLNRLWHERS